MYTKAEIWHSWLMGIDMCLNYHVACKLERICANVTRGRARPAVNRYLSNPRAGPTVNTSTWPADLAGDPNLTRRHTRPACNIHLTRGQTPPTDARPAVNPSNPQSIYLHTPHAHARLAVITYTYNPRAYPTRSHYI